jgi:hypothetical protein
MKKIALLTAALTFMQLNYYAQEEKCAPTLLSNLSSCFVGYGISASLIMSSDGASGSLFFEGTPNGGNVTACLAQYNSDRNSCPQAPLIVTETHLTFRSTKK